MPFEIIWQPHGVLIEYNGILTEEDIDLSNRILYADARIDRCIYQIFNLEQADVSQITLENMRERAYLDIAISHEHPLPRLAFVSSQSIAEALAFHYHHMAQIQHVKWEINTFVRIQEAIKWRDSLIEKIEKDNQSALAPVNPNK